jgi:prepilin-type processing-associated H-X9-DG protein
MYSGFSLSRNLTDLYNIKASCYRTLNPGETTITGTLSHGKGAQVLFTDGIQVHQAWAISWAGSDTATVSPSLPRHTNQFNDRADMGAGGDHPTGQVRQGL